MKGEGMRDGEKLTSHCPIQLSVIFNDQMPPEAELVQHSIADCKAKTSVLAQFERVSIDLTIAIRYKKIGTRENIIS